MSKSAREQANEICRRHGARPATSYDELVNSIAAALEAKDREIERLKDELGKARNLLEHAGEEFRNTANIEGSYHAEQNAKEIEQFLSNNATPAGLYCLNCRAACHQDHNSFWCDKCRGLWPKGHGWEERHFTSPTQADAKPGEWVESIADLKKQPDGTHVFAMPDGKFLINPSPAESRVRDTYVQELLKLQRFAKDIRDNWDCDIGANGVHHPHCRVCESRRLFPFTSPTHTPNPPEGSLAPSTSPPAP